MPIHMYDFMHLDTRKTFALEITYTRAIIIYT